MNKNYSEIENLKVSNELLKFVNNELLKDTNITPEKFWSGFDKSVHILAPKNKELIKIREDLQTKIDEWHKKNKGKKIKIENTKNF